MGKSWKVWIAVAGLLLVTNIYMNEWFWPSKVEDAYDRGKIDGQLLVFEKWGHYSDEVVDQLVDCMHLRAIYVLDSLGSYYDTMPAVESLEE